MPTCVRPFSPGKLSCHRDAIEVKVDGLLCVKRVTDLALCASLPSFACLILAAIFSPRRAERCVGHRSRSHARRRRRYHYRGGTRKYI